MWSSNDNIVLAAATYYINNRIKNLNTLSLDPKIAENPPKFNLPDGDSYSMHCGEIIITTNHLLIFSCSFCNNRYDSISNFSQHLLASHLHSQNESKQARTLAANEKISVGKSKEILKYLVKKETDSFDDLKTALSEKTKRPFGIVEIEGQIEESVPLLKPESGFEDSKSEITLDDEANPQSLETFLESNMFSNELYEKPLHKCTKCDKVFRQKSSLNIHVLSHSNVKKYKCTICAVEFKYPSNLTAHTHRHKGVRKFNCELCDKGFFTSTEAKSHQRVHTGEKPYVCFKCGKCFITSGYLAEHMKRHDNTRPKHCEVCGKSFYNTYLLKNHMAVHSSERPFICTYCPSNFARKTTLRQHIKLHLNAKEFECNLCEKSFNQRPALLSHINNNHKTV